MSLWLKEWWIQTGWDSKFKGCGAWRYARRRLAGHNALGPEHREDGVTCERALRTLSIIPPPEAGCTPSQRADGTEHHRCLSVIRSVVVPRAKPGRGRCRYGSGAALLSARR